MLRQKLTQKPKLNQTLRSWLPILQASSDELKDILDDFLSQNPFATVENKPLKQFNFDEKKSISSEIEALTIYKKSLYEVLLEQISPPLFPTYKSQNIAKKIIECINAEGYFEFDYEILKDFNQGDIEEIRARFAYLEPCGVGAKDFKESFWFQIYDLCDDDELLGICKTILQDFENLGKFTKLNRYDEAIRLIKKLKNPPAIEFLEENSQITPDIFVYNGQNGIEISLNDEHYPEIILDIDGLDDASDFVASRIKQAKDLVDALDMRKATLHKIGLMIIEYQYDYFLGGDIKPMKLKDIADDLGRNPSTISRAIANKFLSSKRGIMPLKNFFTAVAGNDVSNSAIKDFILNLIKNEDRKKPLSDEIILEKIENEFKVKLVRRTITKYRKSLNIGSSSQRKKIYNLQG